VPDLDPLPSIVNPRYLIACTVALLPAIDSGEEMDAKVHVCSPS